MPQDIENSKFRIRIKKLEDKNSNISDTGLSASFTYLTGTYFTSSQSFINLLTASNLSSSQSFINLLTASNLSSSQLTASSIFTNNLVANGNTTLGNDSGDILRITGSANFNNNIVLSSTSGIVFGTIGGSVTSVTLNDYEEGNWTPRFVQSGGTGNYFYQRQVGKYIKIGKLCTVTADLRLTASLPVTNGILLIEGLPHTCASGNGYYSQASSGYYQEFKSTITDFPSGYVEADNTFINLTYPDAGSNRWITNADLLANGTNYSAIIITVSYITV
jgi:hypothetical protein